MKFITSVPSTNPNFLEENPGWTKLESKKSILIIGIFLGVFLMRILENIIDFTIFDSQLDFKFYGKIYFLIPIIIIHELFHWITLPKPKNAIIGLSIKHFAFFVTTKEILTKTRYIIALITPAIFLTIIPFALLFVFRSEFLVYICLYNLIGSGIDFLNFYYLLKMPNNSIFQINGKELYIKESIQL